MSQKNSITSPFNIIVIVAALGYFVDIYDLILFQVIKNPSLEALGLTGQALTDAGLSLMNYQMIGMLVGGILWGILGDRKGRVSVLFGSIIMYSLANLFNAFVTDLNTYALLRFVAGVGLAGELGAGITLVSETMTQKHRGYGTMVVVSFGVLGAVAANLVARNGDLFSGVLNQMFDQHLQNWQVAYIIGGVLGLMLLALRFGAYESHMYKSLESKTVISKGNFFKLFSTKARGLKYFYCIAIGVPIWFMIGVLIALSKDICALKGIQNVDTGNAVMFFYLGTSFGDFMSGYLSQVFKSRKRIVFLYLIITVISIPLYLYVTDITPELFYWVCAFLGIASGYWAVFVTIASEQFGTNIRSTVTTTVPNFVRGALVLLTFILNFFRKSLEIDLITSCLIVGILAVGLAFYALSKMEETYHKELNYTEIM
ncbi:MAG: MFS transporter [Bacteroidetes bacterium]|nr:MFS transporter [Bacteroidota bacterium]MBK8363705.1 MFS transporter [Bacteroidota bacterium]